MKIFKMHRKWKIQTAVNCILIFCAVILLLSHWNLQSKLKRYDVPDVERFLGQRHPVRHVAFLKVHKAGSTTVQNIILRYGWKHDLAFILPKQLPTISMTDSIIEGKNILPPPKNRSYDISCCHVLYNRNAFEKVLPTDTTYIGLLREPFDQFISNINYGKEGFMLKIGKHNPILKFLQEPGRYLHDKKLIAHQPIPEIYNRMAYDFGFPLHLFENFDKKEVNDYLGKLDKELDFVIIMEYMDECLVMIRRLLNWEVKDVVYAALNKGKKDNPILDTGVEERRLYHQWSKLDVALYDFFLKKFLKLWAELSLHSDVKDELVFFREVRIQVSEFCKRPVNDSILTFEKSVWSPMLTFGKDDCSLIHKPAIAFMEMVKNRQISENGN